MLEGDGESLDGSKELVVADGEGHIVVVVFVTRADLDGLLFNGKIKGGRFGDVIIEPAVELFN